MRHFQGIEFAAAHAIEQGDAFDQVVTRLREQAALRRGTDRMAGTSHPLQEGGDGARRAELADQVDVADVDAQLQRCRRHQHAKVATLEPLFGIQAQFARQAAVMRGDLFLAQAFAQMPGRALGHAPGVDEHEGGAVFFHQVRQAVVEQLPHVVGKYRFERNRGHLDG